MALRIWLPLNGNIENRGLSGPASSEGTIVYGDGKVGGKALYMESAVTTNGIYAPKQEKQVFTVSIWFKAPGYTGTRRDLCNEGRDYTTYGWRISLNSNTNQIVMRISTLDIYTHNFTPNTWYHVAISKDENAIARFYVNGELVSTQSNCPDLNYSESNGYVNVGRMGYSTNNNKIYAYTGYLNDFRYYDEALSQKQIKEISKGLVAHYKLDTPWSINNLVRNSTYNVYNNYSSSGTTGTIVKLNERYNGCDVYRLTMTPNETSLSNFQTVLYSHGIMGFRNTFLANTKYCFWILWRPVTHSDVVVGGAASNIGGWTEISSKEWGKGWKVVGQKRTGTVTEDKTDSIFVSFKCPSAESGVPISVDFCCPHLVEGYDYILDEFDYQGSNPNYVEDCSGNDYKAPKSGTLALSDNSPRYSQCTKFNSGYLHQIPSPLNINSDAFTISCWFYPTQNTTMCLINDRKAVGDGLAVFYVNSGIRFDTGSNYQWQVGTVTVNAWNHIVVTWDKNIGNKKFYLNGNLVSTTTNYGTLAQIGDVFSIGNSSTNGAAGAGNQIYGSLSDFRIYVTALSADDIKNLYMVRAGIDNNKNYLTYEFKEPNTDFFEINNLSGATNLKNNSYLISHTTAYDGASIPISNFVIGKTYKMSYYFQKNDGSLQWMGGHAQGYSNMRYYIDGKYISAGYPSNTTSVDFIDDTDIHFAEVYFTCVGGTTNDALYIQPNRGKDVATTVKIYDLKFLETSFPENNNMNIDKRGLTCSTNLLQRSDRSNITENYSLVANSFIEI